MYQKKTKKLIKRGSMTRLREARRTQRLQKMKPAAAPGNVPSPGVSVSPGLDNTSQGRLLLELAWKTVALMHNNRVIQQKILALQKETSDFLASVVNHPKKEKYYETFRLYGVALRFQSQSLSQAKTKPESYDEPIREP